MLWPELEKDPQMLIYLLESRVVDLDHDALVDLKSAAHDHALTAPTYHFVLD